MGFAGVSFAPDGKALAHGEYDGMVRNWAAAQARSWPSLKAHRGGVQCLKFTRDGRTLVTCGKDGKAAVWDRATRKVKATMAGHANHVYSLDLSLDEDILLTGCNDSTAVLWDVATRVALVGTVPGNQAPRSRSCASRPAGGGFSPSPAGTVS